MLNKKLKLKMLKLTFVDAVATVGVPVIFAVVVNASFAVKEQTVLASLQSQGAIFALVKLVTVLRVRIQLQTVRLGARADLAVSRTGCLRSADITTCETYVCVCVCKQTKTIIILAKANQGRSQKTKNFFFRLLKIGLSL